MTKNIKREFVKEYNKGYDSARELILVLLDCYRSLHRCHQSSDANQWEIINDVQHTLDTIDMSYWRDDTTPDQVLGMIQEIEKCLMIIKSAGSNLEFLILEEKVNTALKRCIDVLA